MVCQGHLADIFEIPRATKNDYAHIKAIGVADNSASDRAMAIFKFDGSLYSFTGLAVAEAAITILRCGLNEAKICGGGVLTPATLGEPFIERLKIRDATED